TRRSALRPPASSLQSPTSGLQHPASSIQSLMQALRLNEDFHVHSTFSDGADTIERNVATAAELGLVQLGCVDHVRRDTTYVPRYLDAVRAVQRTTTIELTAGVEAKLL